jgi:O-acetylhomoserine/O-acetylserine sulfhydrylase-like pyridoxal-dependent enzyme
LFQPGDEILVAFDLYGGTFRLFDFYEKQYGIKSIPPSNFAKDSSNAERVGFFVLV